jgi:streptogramin lyase
MLSLTVTTFHIPLVAIVEPQGITTGPDGNLWFAETAANKIGRMTPAGVLKQFSLPAIPDAAQPNDGSGPPGPVAITVGPDGALWFVGVPGEIGRITTAGVMTEFAVPDVPPQPGSPAGTPATPATFTSITAGPDGALWFTGVPGEIGRITTSGVVTEFPVPALAPPPDSSVPPPTANGIVAGPDGALWFAGVPGEIGRITTSGVVTEFPVPDAPHPAGSPAGPAGTVVTPTSITVGHDGALWFTGPMEGQTDGGSWLVGRITTAGAVTEYPMLNFSINSPIVAGPDGNLWTGGNGSSLARITPSGVITTFSLPGNFSPIAGLSSGPDGNVWFTETEDVGGSLVGEQPAIGEITPAGATTLFKIPQGTTLDPSRGVDVNPTAIATARDGAMWFVENAGIGRITTDGKLDQFPLTTPGATAEYIATGPGDTMWFAQVVGAPGWGPTPWSIGRITAHGSVTLYSLPADVASISDIAEAADGDLWFTAGSVIDRITPKGKVTSFPINSLEAEAITIGPNGNAWFWGLFSTAEAGGAAAAGIGEVTSKGQVKVYGVSSMEPIENLISGPGGDLWFGGQQSSGTTLGAPVIGRISTSGKSGSTIPTGPAYDLTLGPDGSVWFLTLGQNGLALGVATRSGIVVTQDPPGLNFGAPTAYAGADNVMTFGPHGNLWLTDGTSSIERISGLDTVLGALDYRHRPNAAPDYVQASYAGTPLPLFNWTNTTSSAQPKFAGVAKPGAEVTLWAQKQGQNKPILIGRAAASTADGAWTLKSHVKLSNGYYAVTATESGHTGPASVLYSLEPDSTGNLSNALVVQAPRRG